MTYLRRIAAAPLLLLTLIFLIGAIRIFRKDLPDSTVGEGVSTALSAIASGAAAYWLLRADLRKLSVTRVRHWTFENPLGQAALLYVAASAIMIVIPTYALLPGFLAQIAFSLQSAVTALWARRWWLHAGLAVVGFLLLFVALAATSEALTPRGYGEGAMIFLLPLQGFPLLLAVSGVVRLMRGSSATGQVSPPA